MDNEKDRFIKKSLQKDQLISRKADETINAFLKEGMKMNQEQNSKNQIKKSPWKKILATAACLVVVLGAGQVYASTQGYGNVFFLIKYLITGQNDSVSGKDEILSDRDITISYEPIKLTDNISLIIKKLQIKDNKATLFLVTNLEQPGDSAEPLTFKVTDNENNLLGEQGSIMFEDETGCTDEVALNNFKNNTKILKLEVKENTGKTLANLVIDLENKTVEAEGESAALEKISEIELKEYLGYAVGLYNNEKSTNLKDVKDEKKLLVAIDYYNKDPKNEGIDIGGFSAYPKKEIDTVVSEMLNEGNTNLRPSTELTVATNNGVEYYKFTIGKDAFTKGECLNITDISFMNGEYTVKFTYWYPPDMPDYEAQIKHSNIYEATAKFKLNDNSKYCKFKLIDLYDVEIVSKKDTVDEPETTEPVETPNVPTPSSNPQVPDNNEKVDNYATSMKWTEYWAPGLKFQYPTSFDFKDVSTGNNPGEVSTTAEGLARGIDPDTKQIIDSNLKITTYEPRVVSIEEGEANIARNVTGFTNSRGMFWGEEYTGNHNIEIYKNYDKLTSGGELVGYVELKIVFETNNRSNYKVTNIINWVLGSTKSTSY